jgi:hypothetical protein
MLFFLVMNFMKYLLEVMIFFFVLILWEYNTHFWFLFVYILVEKVEAHEIE